MISNTQFLKNGDKFTVKGDKMKGWRGKKKKKVTRKQMSEELQCVIVERALD
jgi:hypothetical protein